MAIFLSASHAKILYRVKSKICCIEEEEEEVIWFLSLRVFFGSKSVDKNGFGGRMCTPPFLIPVPW